MDRREFIAIVGGATGAWPLVARAQQVPRVARLGVLLYGERQDDSQAKAVQEGLRELGYVEDKNISFEYRYAKGESEGLASLAADLVQLNPDVLFPFSGEVTLSVSKATQTIPIVFAMSADPLRLGVVGSFARPGGNITGFTYLQDELASKRLALLKEAAPRISRVGVLYNPEHLDGELPIVKDAARALGVRLQPFEIRRREDLDNAFELMKRASVDALYVVSSGQTVGSIPRIVDFAASNRLPLAGGWGRWTEAGGLLSYGPDILKIARSATTYVDKILKGAKPGDLPVQRPTRFELQVNLRTAKALGLAIPESFLLRADKVIE